MRALVFAAMLALAAAAAGRALPAMAQASHGHGHETPEADESRPGTSLYQLDVSLRDQTDAQVRLDLFRGHPVLVSMFYASCPDVCPLLIAELRRLEAGLPAAVRADLRVALVSLDPVRDTPTTLARLAELHRLDGARWRLLAASDAASREVAAVLGVRFRRLPDGVINHSTVVALLDREGVVDVRVDHLGGLGEPKSRLVERLRALAARKAP